MVYLKSLYLHNFRLYEEDYVEFSPGINWIYGRNASGKTSMLEAIHLLASGRSFRTHQLTNLIRHDCPHFYLEALFEKHGIAQKLRMVHSSKERKISINNTQCSSVSSLMGVLLSVVLSPDDLSLISGAPQERRQFLDAQLSQVDPLYLHHLSRYQRAMRQRNTLLKTKKLSSIEGWEYEMATSAAYLLQKRLPLIQLLQSQSTPLHQAIANEQVMLSLDYRATGKIEGSPAQFRQQYMEQYKKNRDREIILASTLVGPHKDDMTIAIGGQEARYYASEGQQRSCATALRLAEWHLLSTSSEERPLMLIDDIGASMDSERCQRLFLQINELSQVFISSTQPIPDELRAKEHKVIIPAEL